MDSDFLPTLSFYDLATLDELARAQLLMRSESELDAYLPTAEEICERVAHDGDAALVHYAAKFDGADIGDAIAATPEDFDTAIASLDARLLDALGYAADNIRKYHGSQLPGELWMQEIKPGVLVGERHTPIDSAAVYVPRGKGSFPSAALMTAIPAVVAGVPNPIMLTPAGPDGKVDAATLAAARLAGIEKVYKAGGATAVAAAAYGTETVPRCDAFEGPGSPWTAAAKRVLGGRIASRVAAGPSEAIVLADESADPRLVALDLLIEAEHGSDSSVYLVTWSRRMAKAVAAAVPEFWPRMREARVAYAQDVLCGPRGGIVLARDRAEACAFVNDYAPEHLQVHSATPWDYLSEITNAAEILLGGHAPGSIANYVMGPNAVLPTSGGARSGSGLSVRDFMKSSSIGHITAAGYAEMAPAARVLAEYEGFDAHANALSELRTSPHSTAGRSH